jgi:hypothetical protein
MTQRTIDILSKAGFFDFDFDESQRKLTEEVSKSILHLTKKEIEEKLKGMKTTGLATRVYSNFGLEYVNYFHIYLHALEFRLKEL